MSARKQAEDGLLGAQPVDDLSSYNDDDVVVIRRSTVITIGVGIVSFMLGGLFFSALLVIYGGLGLSSRSNAPQAAAQPTEPPAYVANVEVGVLPPRWSSNGKITIVEFSDFECPYCKGFQDQTAGQLREKYGDKIRFYYRHFPLPFHPQAMKAAIASMCANEQGKFWEMHDELFTTQVTIGVDNSRQLAQGLGLNVAQFNACLDQNKYTKEITDDQKAGSAYGVNGTPTFFVNGYRLVGAQPLSAFETLINQELAK